MGPSARKYDHFKGPPPLDARIAALAEERHAVLTEAEIVALGVSVDQLRYRARTGRLHRLYPKVYAVGHTNLTPRGRWRAAVLACGPEAALSCQSAGAFHAIRQTARSAIDVSTPKRGRKGHTGIDLHRVRTLDPRDVTVIDHIRVTTVARTLVDLAEILDESALENAIQQSEMRGLLDVRKTLEAIERVHGRRGAHVLRDLLDDTSPPTMNEIEQRFFDLCRRASLPLPQTQVTVGPYVVDFLWPEQRVVVETDGAKVHRTHRAFEHDKVKAADLAVFGLTYVPVTWRRLTRTPEEIEGTIRAVLQAAA